MSRHNDFTSEGFDLDALAAAVPESSKEQDVVLELGGRVVVEPAAATKDEKEEEKDDDEMAQAQALKQKGNELFQQKDWLGAMEQYTAAIAATPGYTTEELVQKRDAWKNEQDARLRQKLAEDDAKRRQEHSASSSSSEHDTENKEDGSSIKEEPEVFVAPPHKHANELAIYHANRAACYMSLQDYEQCVQDCSLALLWNPKYAKALIRRATAYERLDNTELALRDAQEALKLDPTPKLRQTVQRLQKLEDERLEKLKAETLGKLKDLGNSILGNFGLSIDNFQAQQDPQTGSYSISFNQDPK